MLNGCHQEESYANNTRGLPYYWGERKGFLKKEKTVVFVPWKREEGISIHY